MRQSRSDRLEAGAVKKFSDIFQRSTRQPYRNVHLQYISSM